MEKSLPDTDFYKLVKALHFVFKFLFIICIAIMMMAGIMAFILYFLPNEIIQPLLENESLKLSLSIQGFKIQFSPSIIIDPEQARISLTTLLLLSEIILVPVLFVIFQLKKLMHIILNRTPFCNDSVKCIEKVAYTVILISFAIETLSMLIFYNVSKMFDLKHLLLSIDSVESIRFNIVGINWGLLIAGFVILLIAKIFKYGVYLKEEHDATV